jgi:hypothetical protein
MVTRLCSWFIFGAWKINLLVFDVFKRIFEKFYKFILCFYQVSSLNRAIDSVLELGRCLMVLSVLNVFFEHFCQILVFLFGSYYDSRAFRLCSQFNFQAWKIHLLILNVF